MKKEDRKKKIWLELKAINSMFQDSHGLKKHDASTLKDFFIGAQKRISHVETLCCAIRYSAKMCMIYGSKGVLIS